MLTPGTTAGAGYLADGGGPPVLVLHAWWGLVPTVTDVCDRLSDAGFTAFGPDLYDGRTATTVEAATQLSGALDPGAATARVASADRELRSQAPGPLSVVGFSLGASFALDLALGEQPPEKIVCYYGTGEVPAGARTSSAILGHFAEVDDFEPTEWVTEVETGLREAGASVQFHRYPGARHWFAEPDRPEYLPEAAELAWTRTVEFLRSPE